MSAHSLEKQRHFLFFFFTRVCFSVRVVGGDGGGALSRGHCACAELPLTVFGAGVGYERVSEVKCRQRTPRPSPAAPSLTLLWVTETATLLLRGGLLSDMLTCRHKKNNNNQPKNKTGLLHGYRLLITVPDYTYIRLGSYRSSCLQFGYILLGCYHSI